MSKSLSVAVVGCGRMGGIHALHLKERDDVELVGVVDPDAARGRGMGGVIFSSVEELLVRFPGLDAAVVASPTALHSAHARALVEAGVRAEGASHRVALRRAAWCRVARIGVPQQNLVSALESLLSDHLSFELWCSLL